MSETMRDLAKPFPAKFVHTNPSGGGSYIKHHVINQRLIQVLGVPPSFEKVEVIYGDVEGYTSKKGDVYPDLKNVIVAVVGRLTVEIEGRKVIVEEAGDCEQPHNWKTDGQRLKDAMSDAYKRCAMRLGVGLHLWSQDEYFLFDKLSESSPEAHLPQPSNPQAGKEVSGEPLAESAREEPQADNGSTTGTAASPPDSADGGGKDDGSSEVWGSASTAPESTTPAAVDYPAAKLVKDHGRNKVLNAARKIARSTAVAQPKEPEDITRTLCVLVAQELEKVSA